MEHAAVHFIPHHLIDKQRWDECIKSSENGLIYGHSFYLDCMCPGWHALAGDNYDWVLPITHNKKFGIRYLYQPSFTQQLGVFAIAGTTIPWQAIIEKLQQLFKFWEINFNHKTRVETLPENIQIKQATNYILDLSLKYPVIKKGYKNDLVKNLKKAGRFFLEYRATDHFENAIDLYRQLYGNRMPQTKPAHYQQFKGLCSHAFNNNQLLCREIVDENDEIMAMALLLYDEKRLYNIANSCTEKGKDKSANHHLFDSIIQEFAGKNIILDFEGSDLQGVKSFYENFGGINQPFYQLKYNNLPKLIKLFKQ